MASDDAQKIDETLDFTPKFDSDGLMPAIVIEASSGTLLMQAFVNIDALKTTLETGYANFWSRSRQAYWQKGETSGNRLLIKDVLIDCDQDSICFMVEMEGVKAACHTGRQSCYYRKLSLNHDQSTSGSDISLSFNDMKPLFNPKDVYGS
ncbi:MAG: phosphoribosyl-AMP cyclohydrolase [Methyloligella sp.]|nr:MAG: phosphoribosyl-AMP cyclohydrolase [Methyloligella sp.]